MKYSFNWLKELSGTKKLPEKVVEDLTFHSFEVEGVEKVKNDTIIEIKVLPDRAHDAMSHVGVAREIAVLENKKLDYDFDGLKLPKIKPDNLKIEIKDIKLCPRYIGVVMTGIKVKDSPDWMKKRLEASGIRVINNVVDATNYIMLELGQPLHAFDVDKLTNLSPFKKGGIKGGFEDLYKNYKSLSDSPFAKVRGLLNIIVRKAKNKEQIELLDGAVKELTKNDLLITDGDNPLSIAGIKGGKLAEIDGNTKTIILESANFDPINIRKTRMRLGLKTDSSDRFEKDIDPNLAEKAMARLIEIIEHIAGGKLEGISDVYPKLVKPWKIKLDSIYVNKLLGEFILVKDMAKILNLLGIKTKQNGKTIDCSIPTFRIDLKTQEDLIEEIGRIWGYEKVRERSIISETLPAKINEQVFFERKIQDILTGLGFDEVYNYSFYSQEDVNKCGLDNANHLELANPMNPDQKYVRTSLVPNILKNIHENLKNFKEIKIFEEGRVYSCHSRESGNPVIGSRIKSGMTRVEEKRILAMAITMEGNKNVDTFLNIKGAVEDFLEKIGIRKYSISKVNKNNSKTFHPERSVEVKVGSEQLGFFGEVNPLVLDSYKIKNRVAVSEFDLEILKKAASVEKVYEPIGKYPTVTRDISMLAGQDTTVGDITELIKKTGENLVMDVELFDIFQKDEKNSFAFHIRFGLKNRTLEGKEVDSAMENIISVLENELKVEIRK
jgi:phenylalanyl-tRNA synthetase beta chain